MVTPKAKIPVVAVVVINMMTVLAAYGKYQL